jgi:hypothetical protein
MTIISNDKRQVRILTPKQSFDNAAAFIKKHPSRRVLPLVPGTKVAELTDWPNKASNDLEQIKEWATTRKNGKSRSSGPEWAWVLGDHLVIDVDVKTTTDSKTGEKKTKQGAASLAALIKEHGDEWTKTETVVTDTGSTHYIFEGVSRAKPNAFGEDIDSPGYVPIPGTQVWRTDDGAAENPVSVYKLVNDVPAKKVPAWCYEERYLGKIETETLPDGRVRRKRLSDEEIAAARNPVVELDQPEAIERGIEIAQNIEPAISGKGGNGHTLSVAFKLKDEGLSPAKVFEIMAAHFNPRCQPPWDRSDLIKLVNNAFNYGKLPPGSASAKADFTEDENTEEIKQRGNPKVIERETVIRKIRALLKKTTKAGCTADEAGAAATKARELMEKYELSEDDLKTKKERKKDRPVTASFDDFYAFLPEHKYIYAPTRKLWPAESIRSILGDEATFALDAKRPVHEWGWCPGEPELIKDRILLEKGGWVDKPGANTFNRYVPSPELPPGDAAQGGPWVDLVRKVLPDDADRLFRWMAFTVRFPGVKINHGLIVGSDKQGIGKDTMFEPLVAILGEWNCSEVTAAQSMDPKFNPHLEAIFCRISEANDLGESDRFAFYERRKSWMVSPPRVIMVADKNVRIHPVVNVVKSVTFSNSKAGLYLPAEDRRNDVMWSECAPDDFPPDYFTNLYKWYGEGGYSHVKAFLDAVDLTDFDPGARPPQTAAFKEIVGYNQSSEATNLGNLLDWMNMPFDDRPTAVTIPMLVKAALSPDADGHFDEALDLLQDKKARKKLIHEFGRAGYVAVENPGQKDGRWKVAGKNVVIYGCKDVPLSIRIEAAERLVEEMFVSNAEKQKRYRASRKKAADQPTVVH